ncbi:CidA/LrgA family protein [Lawsonibacter sp. LCP25S3_F5]
MNIMAELAIIFGICLVSEGISALLPIALPASVISMLVLLALLMAGIVKPRHIDRVCRFLVANMAFFFVAPCAGIIEHVESLLACLLPFLCVAILTTPLVYAATAWSIQLMLRVRRRKESHHA